MTLNHDDEREDPVDQNDQTDATDKTERAGDEGDNAGRTDEGGEAEADGKVRGNKGDVSAVIRLKEERRELRDNLSEKDSVIKQKDAELQSLRETVETSGVLEACQSAGILPSLIPSAEERDLVVQAEILRANKRFWKSKKGLVEFQHKGQTMTGAEAEQKFDECEEKLERIQGRASRIQDRLHEEHRNILAWAKQAGWKPGAGAPKAKSATTTTTRRGDDEPPRGGSPRRPNVTAAGAGSKKKPDYSKAETPEELAEMEARAAYE